MTYRERRQRKAERLREWAAKRNRDATAVFKRNEVFTKDHAFNTQPGHIPLRARVIAQNDRAFRSMQKAGEMKGRATGIESQLDQSIYDDDPDAREQLTERVAQLEAKRDRMKASNAAFRKGPEAWAAFLGVTAEKEAELRAELMGRHSWDRQPWPTSTLTNLSADIRRNKQRLERLAREAVEGKPWRYYYSAKYGGTCVACTGQVVKGSAILYRDGEVKHYKCPTVEAPKPEWEVLMGNDVIGCKECGRASSAIADPEAIGGPGHMPGCSYRAPQATGGEVDSASANA